MRTTEKTILVLTRHLEQSHSAANEGEWEAVTGITSGLQDNKSAKDGYLEILMTCIMNYHIRCMQLCIRFMCGQRMRHVAVEVAHRCTSMCVCMYVGAHMDPDTTAYILCIWLTI